ncbi:MAG TPA: hypothetical protein VN838_31150 [Bradyrhizobium sp.]|nr:hypothetical protein [Bradyrhizobium sp.]
MPIIRYTCLVGSFLLGMLFLLGDPETRVSSPAPDRWTSVDSLRAMAHLGEPVQGQTRDARFIRTERAPPEPANRNDPAEIAVRQDPLTMNAQASMDLRKTASQSAAAKPRKQKIANRQVRVRTAIADNAPPTPMEMFRPPSW